MKTETVLSIRVDKDNILQVRNWFNSQKRIYKYKLPIPNIFLFKLENLEQLYYNNTEVIDRYHKSLTKHKKFCMGLSFELRKSINDKRTIATSKLIYTIICLQRKII